MGSHRGIDPDHQINTTRPIAVAANGFEFTGLQWGDAADLTVLLLHGFPQRCTSWTAVAEQLAEAGLHAVALDQRGYSPGARPVEVSAYAMPQLIADTVAMIGAVAGSDGAVDLVGHDWGAVVGWQVAARHPELVRSWTAVSTANQKALNEVLATDAEQRAQFSYILAFREPGRAEAALLAEDGARLRALYGGVVAPERAAAEIAFFQEPGVLTAALNWYRAMSPQDADGLPRVAVPTTYVWGSADLAFGRAAAERTAAYVDGPYAFMPLEDASHWLPDEVPDTLAEAIIARVSGR